MTKEGAELLAIAIIKSACEDYRTGKDSEEEFIRFCKSAFFTLLTDCNPDYLIRRMKKERCDYLEKKKARRKYQRPERI